MNDIIIDKDTSSTDLGRLQEIAEDVIRRCRAKGASEADVAASIDEGLSVNVRLGEVETVERTRDRGVSLTVYFGRRTGSARTKSPPGPARRWPSPKRRRMQLCLPKARVPKCR